MENWDSPKNHGCFTLKSYLFWGVDWSGLFAGCLKISPFRANITSMQGSNPHLLWSLAYIANPLSNIKYHIWFLVPKKTSTEKLVVLVGWLQMITWKMGVSPYPGAYVCKKIPLKFTAFLHGPFLYGNSIVSTFRPMGGEFSFYLDIPSWEGTYPLLIRFWVDDFPNFPWGDSPEKWCQLLLERDLCPP